MAFSPARLIARDSKLWTIGLNVAAALYAYALVGIHDPATADTVKHIAAGVAIVCAKCGNSPLPSSLDLFIHGR